jgi:hypothetical protein
VLMIPSLLFAMLQFSLKISILGAAGTSQLPILRSCRKRPGSGVDAHSATS